MRDFSIEPGFWRPATKPLVSTVAGNAFRLFEWEFDFPCEPIKACMVYQASRSRVTPSAIEHLESKFYSSPTVVVIAGAWTEPDCLCNANAFLDRFGRYSDRPNTFVISYTHIPSELQKQVLFHLLTDKLDLIKCHELQVFDPKLVCSLVCQDNVITLNKGECGISLKQYSEFYPYLDSNSLSKILPICITNDHLLGLDHKRLQLCLYGKTKLLRYIPLEELTSIFTKLSWCSPNTHDCNMMVFINDPTLAQEWWDTIFSRMK